MFTFTVICGLKKVNSINTIAAYHIDAATERDAARKACKLYNWKSVKVRKSSPYGKEILKFKVYNEYGKFLYLQA